MPTGTVVFLPPAALPATEPPAVAYDRRAIAAELMAYGINAYIVPDAPATDPDLDFKTATAHWIAHNAMTLTAAQPERPVLLVAQGVAGSLLRALGFSQKASRRPVSGYIVIDGDIPKAGGGDWPDAPVTYVATAEGQTIPAIADNAHQAELRGWTVEKTDAAAAIRTLLTD